LLVFQHQTLPPVSTSRLSRLTALSGPSPLALASLPVWKPRYKYEAVLFFGFGIAAVEIETASLTAAGQVFYFSRNSLKLFFVVKFVVAWLTPEPHRFAIRQDAVPLLMPGSLAATF
jgi:hypothetical protein